MKTSTSKPYKTWKFSIGKRWFYVTNQCQTAAQFKRHLWQQILDSLQETSHNEARTAKLKPIPVQQETFKPYVEPPKRSYNRKKYTRFTDEEIFDICTDYYFGELKPSQVLERCGRAGESTSNLYRLLENHKLCEEFRDKHGITAARLPRDRKKTAPR